MKPTSKLVLGVTRNVTLFQKIFINRNTARHLYLPIEGEDLEQNCITDSSTLIPDKLKKFSLPFTEGYTCFHVPGCGLCRKTSKVTKCGIYINRKTGFFFCEKCNGSGNWMTLLNYLNNSKNSSSTKNKETISLNDNIEKFDMFNWPDELLTNTVLLGDVNKKDYENIFKEFNLVTCTKAIAVKLNIRVNIDHTLLYLPVYIFGSTMIGYKTIDKMGKINTYPNNNCQGLITSNTNHNTAVIVATVPDFFALASQNLPVDVVCLPNGTSYLPQITLPFFEKYKKLILWLGGLSSFETTCNFAKKLNDKRCFIVKPIKNQSSALTALEKNEDFMQILDSSKSAWHKSVISFSSLRDEVYSELQNKDMCAGIMWKKFPHLNKILKGHRRGELTVLTGPTGAGKTTFISEYSLDLAMQGVNTLWGSFEIKNSRLAKKMLQQFSGMPLEENLDKFNYWADKFEQLPIYFMTFHGQQPLKVVMDAVEHCSYVYDIAHVIIDNVQFMIDVSPDAVSMDRFWKQDVLIQQFRSFASKNNCHVTLVMHPKKGMDGLELSINSIFGGAKAAQEADNIMIIQNKMSSLMGAKCLQICKNRFSGDLGTMPLPFDKNSFGFAKGLQANQKLWDEFSRGDTESESRFDQVIINDNFDNDWAEPAREYLEKKSPPNDWKSSEPWNKMMTN